MKEKKFKPLPKRKNRGRPGIDFDALYAEYLESGLSKIAFLEQYGINPQSRHIKEKTIHWLNDVRDAAEHIKQAAKDKANLKENRIMPTEINDVWQIVNQWRKAQAKHDYTTADQIRVHIKLILQRSLVRNIVDGKEEYATKLTATEVSRLASALQKIQHIQRLALGMTTENVGVDKIEPVVNVEMDDDCPVFVVEVSSNGRFIRPRPRQIN
jgi:hypothetical protein